MRPGCAVMCATPLGGCSSLPAGSSLCTEQTPTLSREARGARYKSTSLCFQGAQGLESHVGGGGASLSFLRPMWSQGGHCSVRNALLEAASVNGGGWDGQGWVGVGL